MPSARVTQEAAEILAEPSFQEARVTQDVIEVPIETSDQEARVTQDVVEVPIETSNQSARATQVVVEVLIRIEEAPAAPTGCTAFAYFRGCDIVIWWDDDDADGYELERSSYTGHWVPIATLDEDETVYVDSPPPGLVYTYRIRGIWDGVYSDWCETDPIYLLCQEWEPGTLEANYSIVIRGTDGVQLAIVDDYSEFEYTRILNDAGFIEITASPELIDPDWFGTDYIIEVWRKPPGAPWLEDFAAFHRYKQFWFDDDDNEWFKSIGPGMEDLLKRRIILPTSGDATLLLSDEFTDVMRELVRSQEGASASAARQFAGLSVEADSDEGAEFTYPYRYENLFEEVRTLADLGADFTVEHLGAALFEFRVHYPSLGVDRRVGNPDGNPPIIFSLEMANMTSPEFEADRLTEKTVVYVGGEETGALREIVERGSLDGAEHDSPWNRIESFLESRQETSLGALMAYGDAFLVESREKITFECEATPTVTSLYNVHWDLGDYVTGRFRGVDYDLQIIEVHVTVDSDGEHVMPTFEHVAPVYTGPIYTAPYFA